MVSVFRLFLKNSKKWNFLLLKNDCRVANFVNILWSAFATIFFWQKITNVIKRVQKHLCTKKLLVKCCQNWHQLNLNKILITKKIDFSVLNLTIIVKLQIELGKFYIVGSWQFEVSFFYTLISRSEVKFPSWEWNYKSLNLFKVVSYVCVTKIRRGRWVFRKVTKKCYVLFKKALS